MLDHNSVFLFMKCSERESRIKNSAWHADWILHWPDEGVRSSIMMHLLCKDVL